MWTLFFFGSHQDFEFVLDKSKLTRTNLLSGFLFFKGVDFTNISQTRDRLWPKHHLFHKHLHKSRERKKRVTLDSGRGLCVCGLFFFNFGYRIFFYLSSDDTRYKFCTEHAWFHFKWFIWISSLVVILLSQVTKNLKLRFSLCSFSSHIEFASLYKVREKKYNQNCAMKNDGSYFFFFVFVEKFMIVF